MRLVNAEILKLRKRRGLMVWVGILTVGAMAIAYGILIALHAVDPAKHPAAGGAKNLENALWLLASLGSVAAVMLGVTAGSQDGSSGVFRDLVVSGRSRRTLFNVRLPGAVAVFAPFVVTAFGLAVAASYVFAGGRPTASAHDIAAYGASLGSLVLVNLVLGVSLGSIVSARIATGVLIGWNAVLAGLLASIHSLGAAREGIDIVAATHWAPSVAGKLDVPMTGGTALTVLLIWIALSLRAGALWTKRVDA